jgi:hypothetical protein
MIEEAVTSALVLSFTLKVALSAPSAVIWALSVVTVKLALLLVVLVVVVLAVAAALLTEFSFPQEKKANITNRLNKKVSADLITIGLNGRFLNL